VTTDPKDVVRRGYDALSRTYDEAYGAETKYGPWLAELTARLPARADVVDVGCGSGVPVASTLAALGHRVTGVDLSEMQVTRARERVPTATFIHADATTVDFAPGSLDAVVSLYALIHVPLDEQLPLLTRIAGWLRPGGVFLATMGHTAWTGTDENWLGGDTPMWWSHADARTNRQWLTEAGLEVTGEEFVPEGDGGAALFWAQRPSR